MRCAVSIDLDGIACYYRIHGLGAAPPELAHAIHERAVPRAAALFAQHGIHVTWFVVGADIDPALGPAHAANGERLQALARAGDELGNHSYSHPYELARLPPAEVAREIGACDRVLKALV
ncbi:MAG TPA: polysaccharide deacetylase family protein, partial [Kofleriaceae bacterium]|nr:polysaccharide deacetylase family protein [Kofleriaceae bacterium]